MVVYFVRLWNGHGSRKGTDSLSYIEFEPPPPFTRPRLAEHYEEVPEGMKRSRSELHSQVDLQYLNVVGVRNRIILGRFTTLDIADLPCVLVGKSKAAKSVRL